MPNPLPPPTMPSEQLYGSCFDLVRSTPTVHNKSQYDAIVHEIPEPDTLTQADDWGGTATDDFVLQDGHDPSSADEPLHPYLPAYVDRARRRRYRRNHHPIEMIFTYVLYVALAICTVGLLGLWIWQSKGRRKPGYELIV